MLLIAMISSVAGKEQTPPTPFHCRAALSTKDDSPTFWPVRATEAFLNDPARIAAGRDVWQEQCRHCHGKSAYPGKAPKLKPRRYKPDFVYDRVTNGFRKMPAWKEIYSQDQRMSVVAYILSKTFSP